MLNMGSEQFSFLLFLSFCLFSFSSSIPHPCRKDQSATLVKFKRTLTILDPSFFIKCSSNTYISSWNMSRDCCSWDGVICNEMTGHVIELDLSNRCLVGIIDSNSSLFQLSHLQRLNLSYNYFSGSRISLEFSRFLSLTHLDLSYSGFDGQIPSEISHLSKLQSLSLAGYGLQSCSHDFEFLLQNLTQLREFDLSYINISSTVPLNFSSHLTSMTLKETGLYGVIPESIFHLPNLERLELQFNTHLSGYFPKTKWNSSASLVLLFLDGVSFSGNLLPESLGYLTSLRYLYLRYCDLRGPIPESLSSLPRIESLFLNDNSLNGTIPSGLLSLPSLTDLHLTNNHISGQLEDFNSNSLLSIYLSNNQLQGRLPNSIQKLVNLTNLDLSFNNFSGNVDVSLFSELKKLSFLSLSYNSISLTNEKEVKSTLPESLTNLLLSACEVKELEFLRSAKQLQDLDLSNNKIHGRIPDWAWSNWNFPMSTLNLSHNMLTNVDSIPLKHVDTIDLRSNFLHGSLPIPSDSTRYFFISQNNLSEEIPSSICNLTSLVMLDLSRNNLKGAIPQCLGNFSGLEVLDMHYNSLSGTLPMTFRIGCTLITINFHGNKMEGKIPQSLTNCKQLEVLDVGDNHLNDTFPVWLGTLPELRVLSLRSNKLHGSIRTLTTQNMFTKLRLLDLSYNAFTGNLPTSLFQHLEAMRTIDQMTKLAIDEGGRHYQESIDVVTKGFEREIVRILSLYTTVDLSNNKFEGHIPSIVGDLVALRVLNLSHNGLKGHIPPALRNLSVVESLDLSGNHLVGEIPAQFASLTSLEVLNLSYNHLEGCIPQGNQFNTFENNSYVGNDGLRGFPLSKDCVNDTYAESALDEESNSDFLNDFWKAALMGYGTGLCIGLSIIYILISTGNMKWIERIVEELGHKIMMERRKKQRRQRNYRRGNNRF